MRARGALAGCSSALLLGFACAAGAQEAAVSDSLREAWQRFGPRAELPVIVHFADDLERRSVPRRELVRALRARFARSQAPARELLRRRRHRREIRELWAIDALATRLDAAQIAALAVLPGVESVELDATVQAPEAQLATAGTPGWNLQAIGAPALWDLGQTGGGIVVGSMDTGVDAAHADLLARWRGGASGWFDPRGQYPAPHDPSGHGTQVLGLILAGDASGAPLGVAPGARWIAVKLFDDAGSAALSEIHAGFQWMLDPDGDPESDDAPDIVNNSWALPGSLGSCNTDFEADIELLREAGISVVFSAGNYGPEPDTSVSPANDPGALSVGAVDESLEVTDFSGRGPGACAGGVYPVLVAPGVDLLTSDLSFGGLFPDATTWVSGTSYSAPQVSGAIALLLGAFPGASAAQVEDALRASARDLGAPGPDGDSGQGLIDLQAAWVLLQSQTAPNRPPLASAGSDQLAILPDRVRLDASGSSDPEGAALSFTWAFESVPSGSSAALLDDGSALASFVPDLEGEYVARVDVSDGSLVSSADTRIQVRRNQGPIALDDGASTLRRTPVSIPLLANDLDADGALDPTTIVASPTRRRGRLVLRPDGSVTYFPRRGFHGSDSFSYTVRDERGATSNAATVRIEVRRRP